MTSTWSELQDLENQITPFNSQISYSKNFCPQQRVQNDLVSTIIDQFNRGYCYLKTKGAIEKVTKIIYSDSKMTEFLFSNDISLEDFMHVISKAKISILPNDSCLYKAFSRQEGCFFLLQGGVKVKTTNNTMSDFSSENQQIKSITDEFLIDKENITLTQREKKPDHSLKTFLGLKKSYARVESKKINGLKLKIFSHNLPDKLKLSQREEVDLFSFSLKYKNPENKILFFGDTFLLNSQFIRLPKRHLISVYAYNNLKSDQSNVDNIFLFLNEESISFMQSLTKKSYRKKLNFIYSHLPSLKNISYNEFKWFFNSLTLLFIPPKTKCLLKGDGFYLVYRGLCFRPNEPEITFDEGDFIFSKNEPIQSKSSSVLLYKISFQFIPHSIIESIVNDSKSIFVQQMNVRRHLKKEKENVKLALEKNKKFKLILGKPSTKRTLFFSSQRLNKSVFKRPMYSPTSLKERDDTTMGLSRTIDRGTSKNSFDKSKWKEKGEEKILNLKLTKFMNENKKKEKSIVKRELWSTKVKAKSNTISFNENISSLIQESKREISPRSLSPYEMVIMEGKKKEENLKLTLLEKINLAAKNWKRELLKKNK